jgi:hypothetical protein
MPTTPAFVVAQHAAPAFNFVGARHAVPVL